VNGYPRPKAATPLDVSLVPAYAECTAPNREHGPPLSYGSCAPPAATSGSATVGTADANGHPTRSIARLRRGVSRGDPSTPADEADAGLRLSVTDVLATPGLGDYTGDLLAVVSLRITDRDNTPHPGGPGAATVQDSTLTFTAPCVATADPSEGSTCFVGTTADALVPGTVKEGRRSLWQLGAVHVHDGAGNLFLRQGVFVP
jgi:hypothetical protein